MVQRSLGDRSNEKRRMAATEIEALVKSLAENNNLPAVEAIIQVLSKDFCTSMNANYRKGGVVGLAATAIGLQSVTSKFLPSLLPAVLHCFDDPDSRVRYYACESLYNMAKASRVAILDNFNQIFEGLTKLFADVDVDVKNGANLLDRLMKDIIASADPSSFQVDMFLPVMQNYIRRTNPYIRQLIVGWISLLDSLPDVSMLDFLPEVLDGLFNMLSDSNREIRQAADATLSDFLRELSASEVLEFGPVVSLLVFQCQSLERLNRLTAITWIAELTHHPLSGGDSLLPFCPQILFAILSCISDKETEIRLIAERTNGDLLQLVQETKGEFELSPLLETINKELMQKQDVPTKMASLRWVNMLMEKRTADMFSFTSTLLPVMLHTLSDSSDQVVLLDLQVLSRIALAESSSINTPHRKGSPCSDDEQELQFQLVLNQILKLFAQDRHLLETRGPLIIRKLCVLLNAKTVYLRMARALVNYEIDQKAEDFHEKIQFIGTMVQTLNLILLTAAELHDLRNILSNSFEDHDDRQIEVFTTLFECWCHNPVSTYSLCLLAKAYDLSFALVQRFSGMENISVGFLMQIDKLVHLLESPIFIHLRLQLLNVDAPYHSHLLKSIYGLLMCLPQGDAFRLLNDRLATVCNLRDNLNLPRKVTETATDPIVNKCGLKMGVLLNRFDQVLAMHHEAKARTEQIKIAELAWKENQKQIAPIAVSQELLTPTRSIKQTATKSPMQTNHR